MRILNRPLKIGKERNKTLTAVVFDFVHRLRQRPLNLQNVLRFQDARILISMNNKVSNIIRRLMDNMKLLLICILRVLLSHSFIFFRLYFLSTYIWFYSCLIM